MYCDVVDANMEFQFTRPRGGAMAAEFAVWNVSKFQFTRPRGGAI